MNIYYRDKSFLGVDFHVGSHYWCVRDHSPINFVAEICFFVCCLLTHLCFFALPGLQFQRCWLTRPNNAFRSSFHFRLIVMVAFRKGNPLFHGNLGLSVGEMLAQFGQIWPNGRFSSSTLRAFSSTPPFRRYVAEPCGTAITPKVMGYQVAEDEQELIKAQNEFTNLAVLRSSFRKSNISWVCIPYD